MWHIHGKDSVLKINRLKQSLQNVLISKVSCLRAGRWSGWTCRSTTSNGRGTRCPACHFSCHKWHSLGSCLPLVLNHSIQYFVHLHVSNMAPSFEVANQFESVALIRMEYCLCTLGIIFNNVLLWPHGLRRGNGKISSSKKWSEMGTKSALHSWK